MKDQPLSGRQYDAMAQNYAADNAESPTNAYYERPATIALLGDVEGLDVLEAGCGSGPLTKWLVDQGARVTAFDVSAEMVRIARSRVGEATFLVADLAEPLRFAEDSEFDLVVASLVLHYVGDWDPVLREFHRVLKPEGAVVFSTHHPTMDWQLHTPQDYFAVKEVTETWRKGGKDFEVTFWRRPLTAMTEAVAKADFLIEQLLEPEPRPDLQQLNSAAYDLLRTRPRFLFFRLVLRR